MHSVFLLLFPVYLFQVSLQSRCILVGSPLWPWLPSRWGVHTVKLIGRAWPAGLGRRRAGLGGRASTGVCNGCCVHQKTFVRTKRFDTPASRVLPYHTTSGAQPCLTSVIGRELVYSRWYDRIMTASTTPRSIRHRNTHRKCTSGAFFLIPQCPLY